MPAVDSRGTGSRRAIVATYLVLGALAAIAIVVALRAGRDEAPTPNASGAYTVIGPAAACVGRTFTLNQSGKFASLDGAGDSGGSLRLRDGALRGTLDCRRGTSLPAVLAIRGPADRRRLQGTIGTAPFTARASGPLAPSAASAVKSGPEELFGKLMLAMAVVLVAARLLGTAARRLGQPTVMGEVLAGILLGPTLFGALVPHLQSEVFSSEVVPLLTAGADIGLAFYMFLVGLEFDPRLLRGRVTQAALVSNASVAVPMAFGFLAAVPLYQLVGPEKSFTPFALFMGVAMSITAFPVLARILVERRMLRAPIGTLALAAAAVDDVTAWSLLALASAVAAGGSSLEVVRIIGLTALFCAAMYVVGRRILGRLSDAFDEEGRLSGTLLGLLFVGVLLSSWATQRIGVATIFGAFVMGMVMPRRADLSDAVTVRLEDFVGAVLLPLFFVVTGLKTRVGLLDRPVLWLITLVLLVLAIAGKWIGSLVAARVTGLPLRQSAVLASLMNTRGLTELIVLNIGLAAGVITPVLFTMLVLVALVTTFMAGPCLRLLDPHGRLAEPPEQVLRVAARSQEVAAPEKSVLVAALDPRNLPTLLALAEPLARSEPPRELIVARVLELAPGGVGLAAADRDLGAASAELARVREDLTRRGVAVRTVAFTSASPGSDLVRLAHEQEVDLLLLDGRRPLLGESVPRGDVGHVLAEAPVRRRRPRRAPRRDPPARAGGAGARPVRRRRARLGGARAGRLDRGHRRRAAAPARRAWRRARREPAARQRLAGRAAARRDRRRAGPRRSRARGRGRRRRRCRAPGDRAAGGLAEGRDRGSAQLAGDRRAGPVRPSRAAAGGPLAPRCGAHSLFLVARRAGCGVGSRRAADRSARLDDRHGGRRLRIPPGVRERDLPRVRPRAGHGLRAEPEPGRDVPAVRVQPRPDRSCARSRSPTSCPPTGRRSPSSTPGPGAARGRCCAR